MTKKKQKRYKSKYPKRKFAAGGMYSDNTVMSAGQGGAGSTSNIVYDESNPAVLQQKLQFLEDTKTNLQNTNQQVADQVSADEEQAKVDIENAAVESEQKTDAVGTTIGSALEAGEKSGIINDKSGGVVGGIKSSIKAFKTAKAAKLAQKGAVGIKAGVQTAKQAQQTAKALKLTQQVASSNPIPIGIAAPSALPGAVPTVTGAVSGSANAAGLGAGIVNAAKNPNVLAAAANIGGKAISHFSDDDDATTWNTGEATGDILGTAGEYAGYGAMLTSWLGPGAGIGAAVGGIVGAGVGIYKGLTGRNKARKEEEIAKQKKKVKVDKYNKEVKSDLLSATSSARGAEIKAKTYSGYDLGTNVVARYGGSRHRKGGMNMGTPRYGYAS